MNKRVLSTFFMCEVRKNCPYIIVDHAVVTTQEDIKSICESYQDDPEAWFGRMPIVLTNLPNEYLQFNADSGAYTYINQSFDSHKGIL